MLQLDGSDMLKLDGPDWLERHLLYPLESEVENPVPTGWSIQIVSARVFQLNGFDTQVPLLRTCIGPFYAIPS